MRITLTGATGHSGRWFIERLKKEKFDGELVCLVREGNDVTHIESSGLNYRIVRGTVEDAEKLDLSLEGADVLVHIAGIQVSKIVLTAAIRQRVGWAIVVHTTGRYSKYKSASSEYISIEEDILTWRDRINITVVRPTMIYGSRLDVNMHKLVEYLQKHRFFPLFGSGRNLMQPVHARDLGNAYYDIIVHRDLTINKEYNLSGAKPMAYLDIIKTVSRLLGRKNLIVRFPIWFSVMAAYVYNAIFGNKALINVEQVLRMQEDKDFSYEDAARDFGYRPMTFEDGIKEEIQSMGIQVQ